MKLLMEFTWISAFLTLGAVAMATNTHSCPTECQCFEVSMKQLLGHVSDSKSVVGDEEPPAQNEESNDIPLIPEIPTTTRRPKPTTTKATSTVKNTENEVPLDDNDDRTNDIHYWLKKKQATNKPTKTYSFSRKVIDPQLNDVISNENNFVLTETLKKPIKVNSRKRKSVNEKKIIKEKLRNNVEKFLTTTTTTARPTTAAASAAAELEAPKEEIRVKTAMCVMQRDSSAEKVFPAIPADTQVLIIMQSADASIIHLSPELFHNMHQLQILDVEGYNHNDRVTHVTMTSDALHGLTNLQHLSLQHVSLTNLAEPPFTSLVALKSLRLTHNKLYHLPEHFLAGLHSLEELTLANNPLPELHEDLFLPCSLRLKRLYLNDNLLESAGAPVLTGLKELQVLDMSGNNISHVSEISFPVLPSLRILELKQNPIRVVFINAFTTLNRTEKLSLGHVNQPVHIMKYSFNGLNSLRVLSIPNIENDVLEKDMLAGLTNIRQLTLEGRISSISFDAFLGLRTLEKLLLNNCKLQRLSMDAFIGLKALQILDLSSNRLSKLPPGIFDSLKSLKELDLHGNQLETLPEAIFDRLPLKSLRLDSNPWRCSCDMVRWDAGLIGRVKKMVYRACRVRDDPSSCKLTETRYLRDPFLQPRCQTPAEFQGKYIFEVVRRDLRCSKKKST